MSPDSPIHMVKPKFQCFYHDPLLGGSLRHGEGAEGSVKHNTTLFTGPVQLESERKKTVPSCGFRNELLLERNKRVGYVFQLFQTVDPFLWLLNNRTQIAGYMAVQTKPLCGEYRTVSLFCKKSGTILLPQVLCVSEFFMYQFVTCAG